MYTLLCNTPKLSLYIVRQDGLQDSPRIFLQAKDLKGEAIGW